MDGMCGEKDLHPAILSNVPHEKQNDKGAVVGPFSLSQTFPRQRRTEFHAIP